MSIDYFYSLTPRQFVNILKGKNRKLEFKAKLNEEIIKNQWLQTREIMFLQLKTGLSKFNIKSPKELMPFTWEKENENKPTKPTLTREELKEIFKNIP